MINHACVNGDNPKIQILLRFIVLINDYSKQEK